MKSENVFVKWKRNLKKKKKTTEEEKKTLTIDGVGYYTLAHSIKVQKRKMIERNEKSWVWHDDRQKKNRYVFFNQFSDNWTEQKI